MPYFIGGFVFAIVVITVLEECKKDKVDREE